MTRARFRRTAALAALAVSAGCARKQEEPAATPEPAPTVAAESAPADSATGPATFPAEHIAASYTIPGFDHRPHANVGCTNCHGTVPGHAAHGSVRCLECHGGSGAVETGPRVTPAECQACHHRADPPRDCARCHVAADRASPLPVAVSFTAAGHASERTLPFPHARHGTMACTECHRLPAVTPVRTCASCHEDHHRPDAECTLCHSAPPPTAHDLAAHRGCGGAGCHSDARVRSLPLSRNVCLSCHRDRIEHEPGRNCAECHLITDDGGRFPLAPRARERE